MNDKDKAKAYLQYGENIIDVDDLPRAIIQNINMEMLHTFPTFEDKYLMENDPNNKTISMEITLKVVGSVGSLHYLNGLNECAIVPYRKA